MRNKLIWYAALGAVLVFLQCCEQRKPVEKTQPETPAAPTMKNAPAFNADSAYQFIAKQVSFGPRVPNSAAHRACGDYLIAKLQKLGAKVVVQAFEATAYDGKKMKLRNIIGSFYPEATNRVLLAAHWDTRPFADKDSLNPSKPADGANDGASGVGVLLELGRTLQAANTNPGVGVDVIFFDGEDYGDATGEVDATGESWCLGSQYWAKNMHQVNYKANFGILLDMVGAKGARFAIEQYSQEFAPQVVGSVWRTANQLGYSDYFVYTPNGNITDDHVYMNKAGVPSIDIIDYDPTSPDGTFGKYHHRQSDNMTIIDPKTLKAVGQTLVQVIFNQLAV